MACIAPDINVTLVKLIFVCLVLHNNVASTLAGKSNGHTLHLRTGLLNLESQLSSIFPGRRLLSNMESKAEEGWGSLSSYDFFIVSLGDLNRKKEHDQVLSLIHDYNSIVHSLLPPNSWLVLGSEAAYTALSNLSYVLTETYNPEQRIAPEWKHIVNAISDPEAAVLLASGMSLSDVLKFLSNEHKHTTYMGSVHVHTNDWLIQHTSRRMRISQRTGNAKDMYPGSTIKMKMDMTNLQSQSKDSMELKVEQLRLLIQVSFPYISPETWARLSLSSFDYYPALAAATSWPLSSVIKSQDSACRVSAWEDHPGGSLLISACIQDVPALLEWISHQRGVHWIAPKMVSRTHNSDASVITQTGSFIYPQQNPNSLSLHPFWGAGLNGTGQIIGCGDSGIDLDSCYFFDDEIPILPNLGVTANGVPVFNNTLHRKIRLYLALQDLGDSFGHGTHVTCTLAGENDPTDSVQSLSIDIATGMVPKAKIAFLDIGSANSDVVWTPSDLGSGYFAYTYAVGARVHSDSWGSDISVYDTLASTLDRYLWENQDFVSTFAAGNYGTTSATTTSTITSPALAKNCIAVGATLNSESVYQPPSTPPIFNMTVSLTVGGQSAGISWMKVLQASFGGSFQSLSSPYQMVSADPQDACTGLTNAAALGSVVLVVRGNCYFSDKLAAAQAAGAVGVILMNNGNDGYFDMDPDSGGDDTFSIPMGSIPYKDGESLLMALNLSLVYVSFTTATQSGRWYDDIASYSSFGPTEDGRIKPDVVAPGTLTSAKNKDTTVTGVDEGCFQVSMSGTSMATPVTAGSAVLIRQYFLEGFYPTGSRVAAHSYAPSGALVKAVLLNGAMYMAGYINQLPVESPPSYRQGFGRVDLASALPLGQSTLNLQVIDMATLSQGESHSYCITSTGGSLKITLVWYDYPADPNAALALVNDLDLSVRSAFILGGQAVLGNGRVDRVNTVEQVTFDYLQPGSVSITVTAHYILASVVSQPYALVVAGNFEGALASPYNPSGGNVTFSTGNCSLSSATILRELSTPLLTPSTTASFSFTTATGTSAEDVNFECRLALSSSGDTSTAPLHDWETCTSPVTFSHLWDNTFVFQVRVAGDEVADSAIFTVDNLPPTTILVSSLTALASEDPVQAQSAENVSMSFTTTDMSSVTFYCAVMFTGATRPSYFRLANGSVPTLSTPADPEVFACTPPVVLWGLTFGSWTFQVTGIDAAGNVEQPSSGNTEHWAISYPDNVIYTRLASMPKPLTNNHTMQFELYSFQGTGASTAPIQASSVSGGYVYSIAPQNSNTSSIGHTSSLLTTSPMISFSNLADNTYVFSAQAAVNPNYNSATATSVVITLDTTPPILNITSPPAPVQSNPYVIIKFISVPSDDAIAYYCRWLYSLSSQPDPNADLPAFTPCSGPTPFSSKMTVSNGFWQFQVKGEDSAGNIGFPTNVSFITDTTPPVITFDTSPTFTSSHFIEIVWNVTDAFVGSIFTDISCLMKAVILAHGPYTGHYSPGYQPVTGVWASPCPYPAKYQGAEGEYQFTLTAEDNAGMKTSKTIIIIMDETPPVAIIESITSPTMNNGALASEVTVDVGAKDFPEGSDSGVAIIQVLIEKVSAPPPPPSPPAPPPAVPPASKNNTGTSPNTNQKAVENPSPPTANLRSDEVATLDSAQPYVDSNTPVIFGVWQNVSVPATYYNLPSGFYTVQVRAIDNAGNVGNTSNTTFFQVDAELYIPSTPADSSSGLSTVWIIIIVCVCGAVIIAALIVTVLLLRKQAVKKRYMQNGGLSNPPPPPTPILIQAGIPPAMYSPNGTQGGYPVHYPIGQPVGYPLNGTNGGAVANGTMVVMDQQNAMWLEEQRRIAAMREAEERALRTAIEASIDEERVRKAIAISLEEARDQARLKAAIELSLTASMTPVGLAPPTPEPHPPPTSHAPTVQASSATSGTTPTAPPAFHAAPPVPVQHMGGPLPEDFALDHAQSQMQGPMPNAQGARAPLPPSYPPPRGRAGSGNPFA